MAEFIFPGLTYIEKVDRFCCPHLASKFFDVDFRDHGNSSFDGELNYLIYLNATKLLSVGHHTRHNQAQLLCWRK